ncbi:hypothetical protein LUX39_03070 [Actinomadura madurae]|nr:hypothetical protein [Actinomadura madurae]MCQ0012954.1 hypothetical protein [Actinomadura madurae]
MTGGERARGEEPAEDCEEEREERPAEAPAEPGGLPALAALLRPRTGSGQVMAGLLCLLLGFAFVAQVRSTERDTTFATARQDELVGILSDLGQRSERLRGDLRDLEQTKAELERDARGGTALEDARERAATYGLLAGTLPAEGPASSSSSATPGAGSGRSACWTPWRSSATPAPRSSRSTTSGPASTPTSSTPGTASGRTARSSPPRTASSPSATRTP